MREAGGQCVLWYAHSQHRQSFVPSTLVEGNQLPEECQFLWKLCEIKCSVYLRLLFCLQPLWTLWPTLSLARNSCHTQCSGYCGCLSFSDVCVAVLFLSRHATYTLCIRRNLDQGFSSTSHAEVQKGWAYLRNGYRSQTTNAECFLLPSDRSEHGQDTSKEKSWNAQLAPHDCGKRWSLGES